MVDFALESIGTVFGIVVLFVVQNFIDELRCTEKEKRENSLIKKKIVDCNRFEIDSWLKINIILSEIGIVFNCPGAWHHFALFNRQGEKSETGAIDSCIVSKQEDDSLDESRLIQ